MSPPIIETEGLSKRYALGEFNARSLSRALRGFFRNPGGDGRGARSLAEPEQFWALQNVSFGIQAGEVVGIIGRNGAGKSTLLKILSRVTEPTSGSARIRGRVASLLEVGTGFHPDLSGRDNIYLNGAILGMTRAEIRRKFDEIVSFAEVEQFLDTPVKRYSSGMYVRLAFAVAAHLEPEILIVDEVLAVGDFEFQRKCLGKMQQINSQHGRTVIFVSHDMAAVETLTTRSILLHDGSIRCDGTTPEVIREYVQLGPSYRGVTPSNLGRGQNTQILKVELLDGALCPTDLYQSDGPLRLRITVQTDGTSGMSFQVYVSDAKGQRIFHYAAVLYDEFVLPRISGIYHLVCEFAPLRLASGDYTIDLATTYGNVGYDHYGSQVARFSIPHYSPGGKGWNFMAARGFGLVAMSLVNKIDTKEAGKFPVPSIDAAAV